MTAQPASHSEYQFIHSLLSGSDLPPVLLGLLQKCVQNAVDLFAFDSSGLLLFDGEHARLVALATSRQEFCSCQPGLDVFSVPADLRRHLDTPRDPLVLPDATWDVCLQSLGKDAACSLICVPLFAHEQLLGVLNVSGAIPFSPDKIALLPLLADQATLAITNACQAEQVREANRVKARFLSLVTHELRSPLNSINGYLDLALAGMAGELNEQQREFVQRARAGSEALFSLVEDLLFTARDEAGQVRLSREVVPLGTIVDDVLESLELTIHDSGIKLNIILPAELPPLFVDAARLQQVLRNLIGNALHFTPAGGQITLEARRLARQSGMLEVRVQDTGCGIDPDHREDIFERFVQLARNDGGRTTGQGLGLAVVKTIVELHGGRIRVESSPGKGSVFLFTLAIPQDATSSPKAQAGSS